MLDVRSITLVLCFVSLLQAVGLGLYYLVMARYPGVLLWVWSGVADAIGFLLLLLRDQIPDLLSVVVGNGVLLLATLLLHQGFLRFSGQDRPLQRYLTRALVLATLLGLVPFTFVLPDTSVRTLLVSITVAIVSALNCWNLLRSAPPGLELSFRYTAAVAAVYSAWMLARALLAGIGAPLTGVFQPIMLQALHFLVITLATIAWTVGLIAMITQRMLRDRARAKASDVVLPLHKEQA